MNFVNRVVNAMTPLCEPLHDALAYGSARAKEALPELATQPDMVAVTTHLVRGLALLNLREADLGDWRLIPLNNAGIQLALNDLRLRVLHEAPNGDVPPPGYTAARKAWYCNPLLSRGQPRESGNFLGIWSIGEAGAPSIRVVRPVGPWKLGSKEAIDLDFPLPSVAEDLSALSFTPVDDEIEIVLPGTEGDSEPQFGISG